MPQRLALVSSCLWVIAACEPGIEPNPDIFRAGAYTVSAPDLIYHAGPDGEPLGRVFRDEVVELRRFDDDGWALAHVPSAALPCVWLRYLEQPDPAVTIFNFEEEPLAAPASDECEGDTPAKPADDRSAFASQLSDDTDDGALTYTACDHAQYWKNWDWDAGTGLGPADGVLERGSEVWWRYVTIDGNGVMARRGDDDWIFIVAACVPLQEPAAQ